MITQGLAQSEKHLLERYHDGALAGEERERAERLLAQVSLARDFVASLKEVRVATRAAEQEFWSQSGAPEVEQLLQAAMQPVEQLEASEFAALVPMLTRFHDDEVTAEEVAEIEALMASREDVAGYLGGLGELELGVKGATKEAIDAVDFSGFWGRLEASIDAESGTESPAESDSPKVLQFPGATRERPSFNDDDHQVLLYRYHDGEASEQECQQVLAWQEIDPKVAATLGALEELGLAARASMELAEEHIEPGLMWSMIEDRLEEFSDTKVASLAAHREARQTQAAVSSVPNHRREMFIALAAVLCTVLGVALFGDRLFSGEQVIVEKTVVIVDSLEYGEGTSVMVTGPMQTASMAVEGDEELVDEQESVDGVEEEATPTVIWLIDPEAEMPQRDGAAEDAAEQEAPTDFGGKPI